MENNNLPLETSDRFSRSALWRYQREYFTKHGINAWTGAVPYYITSNTLMGHHYAQLILRFVRDSLATQRLYPEEPLYIIELGTGPGRFSYHCQYFLHQFFEQYQLNHLPWCYVMTDFTDSNLTYWRAHERFIPWIASGNLDFGLYQIGDEKTLFLEHRQITLTQNSTRNSIILIANYVFDTVTHDAFRVDNHTLSAGQVELCVIPEKQPKDPLTLEDVTARFKFIETQKTYYSDAALNQVLENYLTDLSHNSTFLIPIGAIHCINHLRKISGGSALVLAGDKGYTSLSSLQSLSDPHIATHGSISMMVNFHALASYTHYQEGTAWLSPGTEGFKIGVFSFGYTLNDFPDFRWAFQEFVERFMTKEFLDIKNKLLETPNTLEPIQILALLKFSYWDPDIFVAIHTMLNEKIASASSELREEIIQGIHQILNNFYYLPGGKNPLFAAGCTLHHCAAYELARTCYQESMRLFGEEAAGFFNIGLCYYYLNEPKTALIYFERAYKMDPEWKTAKEWMDYLST